MYEQGNGVKVNYAEALKWYRMAAEVGDGVAMNKVGDFYREGLGVAANFTVAQQWYDRARSTGGDDAPVQRPNDRTTYEGSGGE
jgi:TPR repeat protein